MRIIRDSPAELARELAGPYESTSKTRLSRRAKCNAVHAPNTPAPTTTTSNRSIASFLHQWPTLGPTQKARIKNPLKSYPIRPGEAPPVQSEHALYLAQRRQEILRTFSSKRIFRRTAMLLSYASPTQNHSYHNLRRPHASPFLHRHNSCRSRCNGRADKRRPGSPTKRGNELQRARPPAPKVPARS